MLRRRSMPKYHGYRPFPMYSTAVLFIGLSLLTVNFIGVFSPMNNQYDHRDKQHSYHPNVVDVTLRYPAAKKALKSIDSSLPVEEQLAKLNNVVANTLLHADSAPTPMTENWVLYALQWFDPVFERMGFAPQLFGQYEFLNPDTALQCGSGLCSQAALAVSGYAHRMGFESHVVGLNGHVVALVRHQGKEYILDPDYHVFLPFGLKTAEQDTARVVGEYMNVGWPKSLAEETAGEYASVDDNMVFPAGGPQGYRPTLYRFEQATYLIKWVVPIVMTLWGVVIVWIWRRNRRW